MVAGADLRSLPMVRPRSMDPLTDQVSSASACAGHPSPRKAGPVLPGPALRMGMMREKMLLGTRATGPGV
ncbi:MAG: hypothetical protein Kow0056_04540 [Coriobacteriia bacterium]